MSNDSFQEFHGDYEWLFDEGRLIGGKPVPGVGWVFVARSPVRGPASRRSVQDAKRREVRKEPRTRTSTPAVRDREKRVKDEPPTEPSAEEPQARPGPEGPEASSKAFQRFATTHPLGATADGTVEGFASHGAYVIVDGVRSYIPLSAMGDPAPTAARQVLDQGETREFVIDGIDWDREGLDLALAGFESEEAKAAPKQKAPLPDESAAKRRRRFGRRRKDE